MLRPPVLGDRSPFDSLRANGGLKRLGTNGSWFVVLVFMAGQAWEVIEAIKAKWKLVRGAGVHGGAGFGDIRRVVLLVLGLWRRNIKGDAVTGVCGMLG